MGRIIKLTENDIVRIVKKVLSEQPISPLGAASRINLSKAPRNIKSSQWSGKTPRVSDDPTADDDSACYLANIKQLVKWCKGNKNRFIPDSKSINMSKELHDAMDGISLGISTMDAIKKIKTQDEFCKISNFYNYDNQDLGEWMGDEILLPLNQVWNQLKGFAGNMRDYCEVIDPTRA
jgi:hypothetical protein